MAEGGYDPDEKGTFDPNEGADERTQLIPRHRGDEIEMTDRTSTPFSSTSKHRTQETSFMGETPSGTMQTREGSQDEAVRKIKVAFPNAKTSEFKSRIKKGRVEIKIIPNNKGLGLRNVFHPILDEYGNVLIDDRKGKFPKKLRDALGKSALEIATERIAENTVENDKDEKRIKELDEQIAIADGEDRNRLIEEQNVLQDRINVRNQENAAIEEKLTLRQRIKEIFKKHGFTAIAVSTAIATVIGVIVSNLKAGLTKVAKGVGNGLKELGKKLGEILPGMIGAIASFIFRTAGEVIGFLAKNAWLLIVGLVVFAVEQFKNKNK